MRAVSLAVALLVCAGAANATSIAIINPGFEDPILADGDFVAGFYPGGTVVGGWITAGGVGFGAGIVNPTTAAFSGGAPEGSNVAFLASFNTAWLIQVLPVTYQEGETYMLSALVGDADDMHLKEFIIGLYDAGFLVSAGGTSPIPADDGFVLVTATVVADASLHGKPIEIRLGSFAGLLANDPDATMGQVFFDDVRLTVIPVPAAGWLFASGLGLMAWLRREKKVPDLFLGGPPSR